MSLFSALTQLSSSTVDAVMGERLRFTPKASSQYLAATVDPDREIVEAVGVYRDVPTRLKVNDNSVGRDFDRTVMGAKTVISVKRAALAGQEYRAKDIITRLELPGEPTFEISAVDPIADGRLAFTVTVIP